MVYQVVYTGYTGRHVQGWYTYQVHREAYIHPGIYHLGYSPVHHQGIHRYTHHGAQGGIPTMVHREGIPTYKRAYTGG